MNPKVSQVEVQSDYILKITFSNNEVRIFNLRPFLEKGIFKELQNESYLKQVRVVQGSLEWPNEQDFSFDTLYLLSSPNPHEKMNRFPKAPTPKKVFISEK